MLLKMDYKKCLYWLESYDGLLRSDTIYEGVIKDAGKIKVMQNGKHGLLNCDLTTFVPIEYDAISSLYCGNTLFWVLTKNNKSALFNNQAIPITKFIYDAINLDYSASTYYLHNIRFSPYFSAKTPQYFEVEIDKKVGIIDSSGKVIHPIKYDEIRLLEHEKIGIYGNQILPEYFWYLGAGKTIQLKSTQNEVLYQDSTSAINAIPQFLNSSVQPILSIQQPGNKKQYLLNLENKKLKGPYAEVYLDNGVITAFRELNTDSSDYYNERLELIYSSADVASVMRLNSTKELYVIHNSNRKFRKLIDANGIPVFKGDYTKLQMKQHLGQTYFWASNDVSLEGDDDRYYYKYDIYSENGELVNSRTISISPADHSGNSHSNYFEQLDPQLKGVGNSYIRPLLFNKSSDKWGAFNEKGDTIIPFIYDNFLGEVFTQRPIELIGYKCMKNGKLGIINAKNETIYPFEYDQILFNWNHAGLNYFKKNEKGALIDLNNGVILDEIDTIFYNKFLSSNGRHIMKKRSKSPKAFYTSHGPLNELFIVRSDSLYWMNNSAFELCDTAIIQFQQATTSIGGYILKPTGAVTSIADYRELISLPNYYLDVHDSTGIVYDLEGKKTAKIKSFALGGMNGEYLMVKSTNNKVGLRSKDGKKWLIKPNYLEIIPSDQPNEFWVKTKVLPHGQQNKEEWKLVNHHEKNLFGKSTFSHPIVVKSEQWSTAIAHVDDKFGIMNASNEMVLPPIYDAIASAATPGIYFVQKDSMWALFNITGVFSPFYSDVANAKSMPIFKGITYNTTDTLIEIIHYEYSKWNKIVESAPIEIVRLSVDLATPLDEISAVTNEQKSNAGHLWKMIYNSEQYRTVLNPLNNYYLLGDFNPSISNNQIFYSAILTYKAFPNYYYSENKIIPENHLRKSNHWLHYNSNYTKKSLIYENQRRFIYANNGLYSEYIETKDDSKINRYFNNVLLSNPTENISFYDLFENQTAIDSFLYDYIQHHVNLHQMFGPVCLNYPQVYANYTKNFHFTDGGLTLKQNSHYSKRNIDIFIPYDLIHLYLKAPFIEMGEW